MTLADYIGSEQAREDVGRMVAAPAGIIKAHRVDGGFLVRGWKDAGAWFQVGVIKGDFERTIITTAYYRPDGDRFVVTDLGEGVRTACLRGLDLANAEHFERLNALGRTLDADFRQTAPLGWIELRDITAADLPDAICHVMLASLNVAGVEP